MIYKTIIFDFGGVLYNIDYLASTRALAEISSEPNILSNMPQMEIFDLPAEYEKGNITSKEFRDFLRNEYSITGTDTEIDKAWNSMLLGLKSESYNFIKSLKGKYKLALLSNSNAIHYDYFIPECRDLLDLFDFNYFSFNMGMRKPDKEIFDFTLKQINSDPRESLFIDDSEINIKSAKNAGLNVLHFTNNLALSDLLHTI